MYAVELKDDQDAPGLKLRASGAAAMRAALEAETMKWLASHPVAPDGMDYEVDRVKGHIRQAVRWLPTMHSGDYVQIAGEGDGTCAVPGDLWLEVL